MENFVCDNAKKLWELFSQTGSISAYLLYSALQHGKYQDLVLDEDKKTEQEDYMEL